MGKWQILETNTIFGTNKNIGNKLNLKTFNQMVRYKKCDTDIIEKQFINNISI